MTSVAQSGLVFLGLDVSKNAISVGVLPAESDAVAVDRIFSDEESVRRLIGRFPDLGLLRVCYEAGPTGFWLARLLRSMGVSCQVVAPSLIPRLPGDRVKTDLLTELSVSSPRGCVPGGVRLARFAAREQRCGCAAGVVRAGGAAAWFAGGDGRAVRAVSAC